MVRVLVIRCADNNNKNNPFSLHSTFPNVEKLSEKKPISKFYYLKRPFSPTYTSAGSRTQNERLINIFICIDQST